MIKNHLSSHQVYITCKHDKMENSLNTVEQIGQWQKYKKEIECPHLTHTMTKRNV